ncbi:hypothetical protein [Mesorhizobium sp. M1B.F.Ca.ET.045.04.1.1]|uniref:hypothetical protein n=1 Tax=Mesorhizobium sp. M1B.F.Ca.ET.045.04.1.1 TaxID=2493673 RepID=UPI000F75602C|nr:hypothetical protein [Mesorhizobium sp. M1B.F.Ca.ET.045.04.1.1]AZO32358.1 hypothetical protein EJ071_36780 [Mesorhizobium sp. M1B.F.Ca.ET.045.04.1.1]
MRRVEKARPFVPTEIHIGTVTDEKGTLGILSIQTTEGLLDIALDRQAADTIMKAIGKIRTKLGTIES